MLPPVMTLKNTFAAALAALSIIAVPAAPAQAWGKREQGFVAGVATAVIIDELLKQSRKPRAVRPAPGYTFVDPRPVYVAPRHTGTVSVYATTAARAFNTYSLAERKQIQRTLRGWGYYSGGIDGAFGPATYAAVTAFARDEGLSGNLASNAGAYAIYDGLIY